MLSPLSPRRLFGATIALSLVTLAATALAVPVSGRLVTPEGFAGPDASPPAIPAHYWKVWNGFVEPVRGAVDLPRAVTVVLTGEGGAASGCEYSLSGGDFLPRTLVVPEGQEVRITNLDGLTYELESADLPGFVAQPTGPGTAKALTASGGGPYLITDRNLPHVRAYVLPASNIVACGVLRPNGDVSFGDVASGDYTMKVFRDGALISESSVNVPLARGARPFRIAPLNLPTPGAE